MDPTGAAEETDVYYCRIVRAQNQLLVAACDKGLLGRTLREGEIRLEVKEDFYGGFTTDREGLKTFFQRATIGNVVGEKCVEVAVEIGLVDRDHILRIEGVPHAQWMVLPW